MKLIECLEDLQAWDGYQEFMRGQLKLLGGAGEPCFVSKDKISFDMGGKPWSGHAFLVGPKAVLCSRHLKKEGVILREGTCSRDGKELRVQGLDPKLQKGAAKTLKKLLLGFKIAGVNEEGEEGDAGDSETPETRAKRVQELQKLSSDLGRLLAALNK
jgi:hypothetical protein